MKVKSLAILIFIILILFSQIGLAQELASGRIPIKITFAGLIKVDFGDDLLNQLGDTRTLDLNLAETTGSETPIRVITNSPVTVSFESRYGFSNEINDLFEYVIIYDEKGEEKEVSFAPGEYLPTGIIEMEPGEEQWKLIIRLKDNIAEQWQLLLDDNFEDINMANLGEEWTKLEPGVYTDLVNMTFHKLKIDQYMIESFD